MKRTMLLLAIGLCGLAASCGDEGGDDGSCSGQVVTVLSVVDGDTVKSEELDGNIRLLGVQAPETSGTNSKDCPVPWETMSAEDKDEYREDCCYGEQAKAFLTGLLPPGTRICLVNPEGGKLAPDMYQRTLADVYVGSTYVNAKLIVSGYARAYKDFPHPTNSEQFEELQDQAKANLVGLWGYCAMSD